MIQYMQPLRVGVVGVGYLGSIHARIYRELPECVLVAVCDTDAATCARAGGEYGAEAFQDHRELFGRVDAVSIAVPTEKHYPIARDFLKHGIHTLVEKPFTVTVREADRLIELAREHQLILQVGHIERFNSAFSATQKLISSPRFIECHRLSPFPNRSLDIGVVLDLMIHDIDIVMGLVQSPLRTVEAVGVPVLTAREDIANARLRFGNGCIANLTASRISDEAMRKIRIFQENTYISLDYKDARATVYRKAQTGISKENLPIEKEQPLQKELAAFLACVATGTEPLVSGPVAREALAVALTIQKQIWKRSGTS